MTPRRIAYVINVFPKLSETFIVGELAELRRRGVELLILSLRKPTETLRHDFIAAAGLDKIAFYEPAEFPKLLQQFQPQIIHAHFATEPTAAARDFSAQLKIPFTFTAHGYDIRRKPPADFAERAVAAAAVVTVSNANADHIVKNFGVPREKIHVISCGVDTDYFCPPQRVGKFGSAATDAPTPHTVALQNAPLILCVARFVPVKNLSLLLRACACLRERGVKFRCVMIGDGPARAELELLREKLNLQQLVEMPGAATRDEVLRWWQRANVGALTSENEGMPVSLMEAAACGVPVVATNVGGIPELVENEVTGFLVPLNDEEAFASALQNILQDASLAARISGAARARAEKLFSVKCQVDSLLEVWSNILKGKCA